MYIVFISHRLAVLFAFETEDGCRSSETCFFKLKTVCLYLKIISCLLLLTGRRHGDRRFIK